MKSTNRKWQNHLKAKGIIPFFLDRLQAHVSSSTWQHPHGSFHFPISNRDMDDALSAAYFEFVEQFPYEFHIEVTSFCNLKCKMCARPKLTRKHGTMDLSLFKKIIDEIYFNMPHAYIHYYGLGEPLMDYQLFTKLAYATNKGIKNTVLFTNGQLLQENENFIKLANSGLSTIGVDLDGFSPETYSAVRVGGDFNLAKKGIEELASYILKNSINTRLEIAYQVYPGINEGDIDLFIQWCLNNNFEYKLVNMHTWANLRSDVPRTNLQSLTDMNFTTRNTPCPMAWNGFFINWEGRATFCFQDADISECMGDTTIQSIKNIWTGPCKEKRLKHISGNFDGICKNCITCTNNNMPEFNSELYFSK